MFFMMLPKSTLLCLGSKDGGGSSTGLKDLTELEGLLSLKEEWGGGWRLLS